MTNTKPKAKNKKLFDYCEMVDFVEDKYKIYIRDYGCFKYAPTAKEHKSSSSFNVYHQIGWENANYPRLAQFRKNPLPGFGLDQEGMDFYKTQEGNKFFDDMRRAYEKAPDGKCKEIPYLDFWHFMLDDYFGGDISNGCTKTVNWQDVVDIAKEDWQKEIAELFVKEFGKKDIEVDISW